jgi:hypothetical protein
MSMELIKKADTQRGYGIAILKGTYRTGGAYYDVVRYNRQAQTVTIHSTSDYEKARQLANREWLAER